jgi:UDP-3-O-[3-hydroxymyristoyl] glucosamine N-acyltransferase
MVDTRFHPTAGPMPLDVLIAGLRQSPQVDERRSAGVVIHGAEELEAARAGDIALAARPSFLDALRMTGAGAVVVHPRLRDAVPPGTVAVVADDPQEAFADILVQLYPGSGRAALLAQPDGEDPEPLLEEDVELGPGVVLGRGVEIGRGTVIGPNAVIGDGVAIGRNCVIGPSATVEYAYLGNNVVVRAGARVGGEGFGWIDLGGRNRKMPQIGRVILQDNVEIGANTTVDRGALGDTVIGEGTKVDNLVQIGHNCRIGRRCLIAGQTGLAGSTIVEDSVLLGGRSASAGHLTIGRGARLAGNAVATRNVPPGAAIAGFPAREVPVWRREIATLRRLSKGNEGER